MLPAFRYGPHPLRELDGAARGAQVKVGADGRILIPAALRKAAGLEAGKTLVARLEDDRIVIEDPLATLRRIQKMLEPYRRPGVSVVDELIADRRAEAERE